MAKTNTSKRRARGGLFANRFVVFLSVLLTVLLVLAFASFFHSEQWGDYNERFLIIAVEQQTLAQQQVKAAVEAAQADEKAFARLSDLRGRYETLLQELKHGTSGEDGLPPSPPAVATELDEAESAWLKMGEGLDRVLEAKDDVLGVRDLVQTMAALLPELADAMRDAAGAMVDNASPQARVLQAAEEIVLVERMSSALSIILAGGATSQQAIDSIATDKDEFGLVLKGLIEGNADLDLVAEDNTDVLKALKDASLHFNSLRTTADELLDLVPTVFPALDAINQIQSAGERLNVALTTLIGRYQQSPGRLAIGPVTVGPVTVLGFGALAVLTLILLGSRLLEDARSREAESKAQNEANQQAILRLLDEMGDLADGDLTVEATVTEDITGAIADSINYAVDALRVLVTTINETSEKVTDSAQSTRSIAMQLAEASEVQTKQIDQATGLITSMTEAIDEMAQNATESAEVASRSLEVAGRGAQTVRDTIQGMDSIREQIQETSKRIKRLGESSQEIGEIVELIDDIADQTNILALNAAMQAAMAGEAGRGFAVVADEVQRLAERSRNATKQIEALVRTIQADTNEAVSSMEASTAGVVDGATLAENAGDALREIENVSTRIADLTRRIADTAQNQSGEAGKINTTVSAIQDITVRNAEGTKGTVESVELLAELAVELQGSVAGFRLP